MRGLGLGIALALGGAVAVASERGSAIAVGHAERTDTWSILFLVATAVAFCLYVVALTRLRYEGSFRLVCVFALAIQLVPLAGPLLLSRDAYSYWAYGRIVVQHEADPYTLTPARYPHDPATREVAPAWRNTASDYGPAFTAASSGIAALVGRSQDAATFAFRATAAIAVLLAALLAAQLARRKAFAAAFVGWNPLLALDFAGGGHNDAWMAAALLAALLLLERGREAAGGALWIAAAAIKLVALPLLVLRFVRPRRAAVVGAFAAAAAVALAATLAFGTAWVSALSAVASREAASSIPVRLANAGLGEPLAFAFAYGALLIGALWLLVQALRGRRRLALGACVLLVTSPWILPWYAIWPVALAAVEEDATAQIFALSLAAYLLPDRVPI